MNYEVITSEVAEAEASDAFLWHNRVSPTFAARWYSGLLETIASLDTFPRRCPLALENDDFPDKDVRQLLYRQGRTSYRILFCIIEPDIVRVLHVRNSSRNFGNYVSSED